MYSKSIVSVVCIPGWSGSRYAIAPGNFCSASFRAASISDGAAEVAPSGGSVNKPNRNPPRGGKYVTCARGDPSSGKVGATSAPQRRWNSSREVVRLKAVHLAVSCHCRFAIIGVSRNHSPDSHWRSLEKTYFPKWSVTPGDHSRMVGHPSITFGGASTPRQTPNLKK